ncbi:18087_t:CDS:1, partial [Gigaspora margarita]
KTKHYINKPTKVQKILKLEINPTNDLEIQKKQLILKVRKLELEECKVQLEYKRLELIKLKKELETE